MKTLGILIILISTNFVIAQVNNEMTVENEVEINIDANQEFKVLIDVDSTLYPKTYPPPHDEGYWSKNGKAFLRAGYRQRSYKEFKGYMNSENTTDKNIESKEVEINGISFLYKRWEQNRAGEIVEIISYMKSNDENSVIEVGGFFPEGEEAIYKLAIEQAATSAKLIKE